MASDELQSFMINDSKEAKERCGISTLRSWLGCPSEYEARQQCPEDQKGTRCFARRVTGWTEFVVCSAGPSISTSLFPRKLEVKLKSKTFYTTIYRIERSFHPSFTQASSGDTQVKLR